MTQNEIDATVSTPYMGFNLGAIKVHYNYSDDAWSESQGREVEHDEEGNYVPLRSNKGFKSNLRLESSNWI